MTWILFYLCCLVAGAVFCATAALTGGHGQGAHHPHVYGKGAPGHAGSSWAVLNAFTVTAFLCWFGGVGYLLQSKSSLFAWLTLLAALAAGIFGAAMLQWFLTRVLLPRERVLTAEETAITGVVGHVSGALSQDRVGEVIYRQLGARRSVPARSADGSAIARDQEVVVLRYEEGIAYVQPWCDFELDGDASAASAENNPSRTNASLESR